MATRTLNDADIMTEDELPSELKHASPEEINNRARLLENEIKILKNEYMRLNHEVQREKSKIQENTEKIKLNKQLPYLVGHVVEVKSETDFW